MLNLEVDEEREVEDDLLVDDDLLVVDEVFEEVLLEVVEVLLVVDGFAVVEVDFFVDIDEDLDDVDDTFAELVVETRVLHQCLLVDLGYGFSNLLLLDVLMVTCAAPFQNTGPILPAAPHVPCPPGHGRVHPVTVFPLPPAVFSLVAHQHSTPYSTPAYRYPDEAHVLTHVASRFNADE